MYTASTTSIKIVPKINLYFLEGGVQLWSTMDLEFKHFFLQSSFYSVEILWIVFKFALNWMLLAWRPFWRSCMEKEFCISGFGGIIWRKFAKIIFDDCLYHVRTNVCADLSPYEKGNTCSTKLLGNEKICGGTITHLHMYSTKQGTSDILGKMSFWYHC